MIKNRKKKDEIDNNKTKENGNDKNSNKKQKKGKTEEKSKSKNNSSILKLPEYLSLVASILISISYFSPWMKTTTNGAWVLKNYPLFFNAGPNVLFLTPAFISSFSIFRLFLSGGGCCARRIHKKIFGVIIVLFSILSLGAQIFIDNIIRKLFFSTVKKKKKKKKKLFLNFLFF